MVLLCVNPFHRWAVCTVRWHAGHFRRTLRWPSDLQPHHDSAEWRIPDRRFWICFQTHSVPLGVSQRGSRPWDLHLSDIPCTWPRALRSQQQTSFYYKLFILFLSWTFYFTWSFYRKILFLNSYIFYHWHWTFEVMKLVNITHKCKYKYV